MGLHRAFFWTPIISCCWPDTSTSVVPPTRNAHRGSGASNFNTIWPASRPSDITQRSPHASRSPSYPRVACSKGHAASDYDTCSSVSCTGSSSGPRARGGRGEYPTPYGDMRGSRSGPSVTIAPIVTVMPPMVRSIAPHCPIHPGLRR